MLVFVFEGGHPLWVGFFPAGEEIVTYQAQWLVLDGTTITTESALSEALSIGEKNALTAPWGQVPWCSFDSPVPHRI